MSEEVDKKLQQLDINEEVSFDLKKKKKKKTVEFNLGSNEPKDSDDLDPETLFSDLKKKKKKKPKNLDDEDIEGEEEEEADDDVVDTSMFGEKKKKKKKKLETEMDIEQEPTQTELDLDAEETWHNTDRDYTYNELLIRIFKILKANNPELSGEKRKYTLAPPQVFRDGNKKTIFANIVDICKKLRRQPDHLIQYIFSELGTNGSIDGTQRLVIKGRFQSKQIETLLRRYIVEYVSCKTCKSPDTNLTKENRLFFVHCEACGSSRSVTAIKSNMKGAGEKRAQRRADKA